VKGPVRTGVIGVGYIGKFHADKFSTAADSQLTSVVDIDQDQCKAVAQKLGVNHCTDYRSILPYVDAVSVATPPHLHYEMTKFFLENGKHVLTEKPFTEKLDEADELIHLAERKGLILQVGHIERFNPAFLTAKPYIHKPIFIEATRCAPYSVRGADVSVVFDLMIHDIDLVLNLNNSPLSDVSAVGACICSDNIDIANARLTFTNGCIADITASRIGYESTRTMIVTQNESSCELDFQNKTVTGSTILYNNTACYNNERYENTAKNHDMLFCEIESFIHSITSGKPSVVSGHDGRFALDIALKINSSIENSLCNHAAIR